MINFDESSLIFETKKVRLLPSGEIMAKERFTIDSFCVIASEYYPMDEHVCLIMMEFKGTSVEVPSTQLTLNKKDINTMHNKWWVHSPKMRSKHFEGNEKFKGKTDSFVVVTFVAARHFNHEMKNVVFPMFLLGLIASLSIMIPGQKNLFYFYLIRVEV